MNMSFGVPTRRATRPGVRRDGARYGVSCYGVLLWRSVLEWLTKPVLVNRCEMKNLNFAAELHLKVGAPASGTVESLRLLRAFLKLAPRQRFEVIKLVEDLATEEALPEHPLS